MSEKSEKEITDFPLPQFLRLIPERLAENAGYQEMWKKRAVGRDAVGDEKGRAVLIEADARKILDDLAIQYPEVARGEKFDEVVSNAFKREGSRLAEALAVQGRFDEAAAAEPKARKGRVYAAIWAAVWRDDAATCPCPEYRAHGSRKLLNDVYAKDVFSLKHSAEMALVKCNNCGFLNVRSLTQALSRSRQKQEWLKT